MKGTFAFLFVLVVMSSVYMFCDSPNQHSDLNPDRNLESNSGRCKELAGTNYTPVTPGEILCIARDSSGVHYVVDKYQHNYRLFISKGDTLYRTKVSGSSVIGQQYYFLSLENGRQLIFQNQASLWSDAYVLTKKCSCCDSLLSNHINRDVKDISHLAAGWSDVNQYLQKDTLHAMRLTTEAQGEIAAYSFQNYPPATHIEYVAQRQSGQYILVTRPYYDWNGEVVVHYGLPDHMNLCHVDKFLRATDGGSTWITFNYGSKSYLAFFGVKMNATGFSLGRSWIKVDGDTLDLERKSKDIQSLNMLGFNCSIAVL